MSRPLESEEELIRHDVTAWLAQQEAKELLRFITCGSVDDGKSTLIGRLLYESKQIFDDQLDALESDSKRHGTQGAKIDFALLVDGLSAEREQGITIDVAYRFFTSAKRKFIVADTPGHEQYTRNMVTGASTADLAVLLVDARKGVLTQTRRHSYLAKLVGIRRFVLAVNKMDLVDYDRGAFDAITADYRAFAEQVGIEDWVAIPVSGLGGDNIMSRSEATAWYDGRRGCRKGAPDAGAMGQPAEPEFPRLFWPDRLRADRAGRGGARASVGADDADRARCYDGRRPRRSGCRAIGHADLRRRDRLLARRRDRGCRRPARGGRPV